MNHDVEVKRSGQVGYLVLNNPATLNALTLGMIEQLHDGLRQHENNTHVKVVVICSTCSKAFCAGGNMKQLRQFSLAENYGAVESFFDHEYALNLAIADCAKPYVAIIDGIAMGGGLGLSIHGRVRIVTERAVMAMPESRIGFFPDVGASYFLPRLNQHAGTWLALTAVPVRDYEAVQVGLATHYIKSADLPGLMQELESSSNNIIDDLLRKNSKVAMDNRFVQLLQAREYWFENSDIAMIRSRLETAADAAGLNAARPRITPGFRSGLSEGSNTGLDAKKAIAKDAQHLLEQLDSASPYSLQTTLELFDKSQGQTLKQCLRNERSYASAAVRHPDFFEGVRAVLIDKDHQPRWLTIDSENSPC